MKTAGVFVSAFDFLLPFGCENAILTVFNVIAQKKLRCPIWIMLIGLYVAIRDYLLPLVIILAITSILDDLLFTPLIHYYYTKTVASKTIDQREDAEAKAAPKVEEGE